MTDIQNIEYFKLLFWVNEENNTKDVLKIVDNGKIVDEFSRETSVKEC